MGASERESLYSQIESLKERLASLQKDHERQSDDLLREQTLRKSEMAQMKIENFQNQIDQAEAVSQGMTEPPNEIKMLPEPEPVATENVEIDDIENLKLQISE